MTDKLNGTPGAGNDDDKISTTSSYKRLTTNLRSLEAKRRTYRRTLQQYERIKGRYVDNIAKLNKQEPTTDKDQEGKEGAAAPVDPKKQLVIASYRLLRNFCISFNTINQSKKEDDRQELPEKYAAEIETILGTKLIVEKFNKALKADNVESSISELPTEVPDALVKGLIEFISKHDKDEIIAVLNKELDEQTAEIDKMRAEQKTKKVANKKVAADIKQKQVKKTPKSIDGTGDDSKEKTTEQRFRDLIKEVQTRVSQIKLEKDDYQTYTEVQSEVDNFLDEATTEILSIKNGLRKRFENVQNGKGEPKKKSQSKNKQRNKARVPRKANDEETQKNSETLKKDIQQNSVFSKDQLQQ